jgi:hypothetical protein
MRQSPEVTVFPWITSKAACICATASCSPSPCDSAPSFASPSFSLLEPCLASGEGEKGTGMDARNDGEAGGKKPVKGEDPRMSGGGGGAKKLVTTGARKGSGGGGHIIAC